MEAGQRIAGRYVVEKLAGAGGMGRVYRALDDRTGDRIALKVLNLDAKRYSRRFQREARLLAELDHPGIVRYVDSGVTDAGAPFIVMAWVEGEDLRTRMNRKPLSPDEALLLARQVSRGLGAAHERGVVHRDLKPSNLMLVDRDLDHVVLLDFGIARWRGPLVEKMTKTGISIGTPGYMAPEQARGDKDVGGAADVYALGCVLFECLTGRRPFSGDLQIAVLAKTVVDAPPRVADVREDVGVEFDELLARMLASDPAARPRDGAALAAALDAIDRGSRASESRITATPSLTRGEKRLLCVILVGVPESDRPISETVDISPARQRQGGGARLDDLSRKATEFGGRLDRLANGSAIVTFSATRAATDLVAQAARCALSLHQDLPLAPLAIATGRGEVTGPHAIGEAIDRAASLLSALEESAPDALGRRPIRIDAVTAGLLDARFDVGSHAGGIHLRGERAEPQSRSLLGRSIPCVGRERELGYLTRMFEQCDRDERPRAALLVAPAGVGKSRLCSELVQRVRSASPRASVWLGRGDPVTRGAAFDILAQIVRSAARIVQEEPLPLRRQKLELRVGRSLEGEDARRVTEFLGEMIGTPFPATEDRVQLRAARGNAVLMGDQIRRAWEDFLSAEVRHRPTLILLEDLHWGDLPTVRLIDGALRNVTRGAWMLLAIARPEVHERFPELWSERAVEIVELGELDQAASRELVDAALGDRVDPETRSRLLELAAGNAFYLEELIRAVDDRRVGELPGTILAMAQARLGELPADARRVLRAASVFGRVFWRGGVAALVARGERDEAEIDELVDALVEQEFVAPTATTIFPGEAALVFRHEVMREAAYSTLTERDRILGHRLAGDWLERAGSHDALTLATHFEIGREPKRATEWYRRSADQALEGNDLAAALRRAGRGAACGATGPTLGALRAVESRALLWEGDFARAFAKGREALRMLETGSSAWYTAAGDLVTAAGRVGEDVAIITVASEMLEAAVGAELVGAELSAMARAASHLFLIGRYDEASLLTTRLPDDLGGFAQSDPAVVGYVLTARANRALCDGDPGSYLELCEESAHYFDLAGDRRSASISRVNVGFAYAELGDYHSAESVLRGVLEISEHMELSSISALARNNLGAVLTHLGQLDEAWDLELVAVETFGLQGDERLANGSRVYLARVHELRGHLEAAEREAREAVARTGDLPTVRTQALAQLASILLAQDRAMEALDAAERAVELQDSLGHVDEGEARARLVLAEAYNACDRHHEARATIADAHRRLLGRAEKIVDPRWRTCFVQNVDANRRTLELARLWGLTD